MQSDSDLFAGRTRKVNREINRTYAFSGIAFSPDGLRFVTASRDGTARVYAFKVEDLVALARQRVTRSMTQAECQQYYMLSNAHPNMVLSRPSDERPRLPSIETACAIPPTAYPAPR